MSVAGYTVLRADWLHYSVQPEKTRDTDRYATREASMKRGTMINAAVVDSLHHSVQSENTRGADRYGLGTGSSTIIY